MAQVLQAQKHMKGRVLVVDDDADARGALAEALREGGYAVETAADAFKGLGKVPDFAPDLVLTDLKMPGMDGLELLSKLRSGGYDLPVVVTTAFSDVETAVTALKQGAADYLTKPLDLTELYLVVAREMDRLRLRREAGLLRARLAERYSFSNLVGSSPAMQYVLKVLPQVAASKASVLITGEPGTGKELIAAAIHEHSSRDKKPFLKLHCAALAEPLLESELFGHESGALPGSLGRREGRLHQAAGGTLFLDEISALPPALQVRLLRFLQDRTFQRMGGEETLDVDVRVIAASNHDLREEVALGRFREDLFYRLNVVNVDLPPLRARPSDVLALAMHFLRKYAGEDGKSFEGFSDEALQRLAAYEWPGNVRELENAIAHAVVLASGPRVTAAELPPNVGSAAVRTAGIRIPGSKMEDIERHAILTTLEATGGSTTRAAEILGMSVRTVQYRLQQYHSAPKSELGAPVIVAKRPD
jgi:Response regulator containing CheY-like receiver, AAA-type ATPase, and DNA-binding domains